VIHPLPPQGVLRHWRERTNVRKRRGGRIGKEGWSEGTSSAGIVVPSNTPVGRRITLQFFFVLFFVKNFLFYYFFFFFFFFFVLALGGNFCEESRSADRHTNDEKNNPTLVQN